MPTKRATRRRRRRAARPVHGSSPLARYVSYFITLSLLVAVPLSISLHASGRISDISLEALATMELSLLMPSVVVSYLFARGKNPHSIVRELGLGRDAINPKIVAYAIMLFASMLLLALGMGIFSSVTGIQLPTNVNEMLGSMPLYLLVFAVVVAPINEEVLFRGFLVNRLGIVGSAIFFGLIHYVSYASISEFIAALAFGLLAGYVFKRTGSIYASIGAHVLVNALAVSSVLMLVALR